MKINKKVDLTTHLQKAVPKRLIRDPKPLQSELKEAKLWKRKPPKLSHSQFLFGLRRLRLYNQWKNRYFYYPEITNYARLAILFEWAGIHHHFDDMVNRFHRLVRQWKTRLKHYKSKPDYKHLKGIYRRALNEVFGSMVRRFSVTADSAIFGDVAKTYHQALCPGYQPKLFGIPLVCVASIRRNAW